MVCSREMKGATCIHTYMHTDHVHSLTRLINHGRKWGKAKKKKERKMKAWGWTTITHRWAVRRMDVHVDRKSADRSSRGVVSAQCGTPAPASSSASTANMYDTIRLRSRKKWVSFFFYPFYLSWDIMYCVLTYCLALSAEGFPNSPSRSKEPRDS